MSPEENKPEVAAVKPEEKSWFGDNEKAILLDSIMTVAPALIGFAAGGQSGAAIGSKVSADMQAAKKGQAEKYAEQLQKQQEYGLKEKDLGLREKQYASEEKYRSGKLDLEKEELAAKRDIEAAKLAKGQDSKILTGEQTKTLADIDSASQQMSSLEAAVADNADIMGPIAGRISSASPWATKAKAFDAQMKIAAQNIGKSLEGGKLTDSDIMRYREMLPQITDTPDIAKAKIAGVNQLLGQRRGSELDTLKRAGYGVGGFEQVAQKQGGPKPPAQDRVSGFGPKSAVAAEMPDFDQMSDDELKKYLGR